MTVGIEVHIGPSVAGACTRSALRRRAIALDHHTVYLVGWIAATLAAFAVLLTPWSLEPRVVVSLLVGPVVGVAVHLGLGRRGSADHRFG